MSARIVHLLRHGPPLHSGLLLGHTDMPALNSDCPQMRARVEHLRIDQVVASDLTRAAEQAKILADHFQVPLTLDANWRELSFGAWDGLAAQTINQAALTAFWDDPDAAPPSQGERWSDLRTRVSVALDALATDTLVVAHGGAMRAAVSVLTGLDHRGVWAIDLPYRGLLSLCIWKDGSGQVTGLRT
ncbi:histidine phosphatase family protein [Novosphingobium sp. RD2P27]|uniref:Histidine phosphatase family protein n=1 Tax=Novosphingobium kalidii TaxID=3230299 RepID=A0ABV2CXL5_9SPHN